MTTKPRARPGPAPGPAVQLATALARLSHAGQPSEVTELPGGLTNHNYRVRSLDLDVVGRSAVEAARAVTPPRRVVSFVVRDPTAYPWGGELVLRDGRPVGQVTSAAWGATVGAGVGLALVGDREAGEATGEWVRTGEWVIDVAGDRRPLTVGLRPPLDPLGLRLRRAAADAH